MRRFLSLTVAGLALAACSSGSKPAPAPTTTPASGTATTAPTALATRGGTAAAAHGWSRTDITPVSQPLAVGGDVALYAVAAGKLEVLGLDPATGKTLWTEAASSSAIAPGQPLGLLSVGGSVVYLQGEGTDSAELVAADPATGTARWHSAAGEFGSQPALCPGSDTTICATGVLSVGGQEGSILRFSAADGSLLPGARLSTTSADGRELGDGIFDPGERSPEQLVASDGATVAWEKPVSAIFTAAGSSSDYGWNIDRLPAVGLFVGYLGTKPAQSGKTQTEQLGASMTAGFRISDGTVAWRSPGTLFLCSQLPCAGGRQRFGQTTGTQPAETVGVRLRATGTVSYVQDSAAPTVSADATGTLEGFDLATGKTTWTFDAGHDTDLLEGGLTTAQSGEHTIVVPSGGHAVTLDLSTGRTGTPPATLWCRGENDYSQGTDSYVGESSLFACGADGKAVATPASAPAWLGDIGAAAGGLVIWSGQKGVTAAPVG